MIISYASTAAAATAAIGQFVGNLAAIAKDITYLLLGSSANTPKQDFYSLNAATVTYHLQHAQSLNVSNVNACSMGLVSLQTLSTTHNHEKKAQTATAHTHKDRTSKKRNQESYLRRYA